MVSVICQYCSKSFSVKPSRLTRKFPVKFCSLLCRTKSRKGDPFPQHKIDCKCFKCTKIPWNKDKKGLQVAWNKGKSRWWFSPTEFRKGDYLGKNHPQWKGDRATYGSIHSWVGRQLGKPDTCEHCGLKNLKGHKIHWANISGKNLRIRNDWKRLCARCHHVYDFEKLIQERVEKELIKRGLILTKINGYDNVRLLVSL